MSSFVRGWTFNINAGTANYLYFRQLAFIYASKCPKTRKGIATVVLNTVFFRSSVSWYWKTHLWLLVAELNLGWSYLSFRDTRFIHTWWWNCLYSLTHFLGFAFSFYINVFFDLDLISLALIVLCQIIIPSIHRPHLDFQVHAIRKLLYFSLTKDLV